MKILMKIVMLIPFLAVGLLYGFGMWLDFDSSARETKSFFDQFRD
jgi:hypothetical protein